LHFSSPSQQSVEGTDFRSIQIHPTTIEANVKANVNGFVNPKNDDPNKVRYTASIGEPQQPSRKHPAT
jgi:hypothetical protein